MKVALALSFAVLVVCSSRVCAQGPPQIDPRRMILEAPSPSRTEVDAKRLERLAEIRRDLAQKVREEARHKPNFTGRWTAIATLDKAAPIADEIVVKQRPVEWRIVLDVDWQGGSFPRTPRTFDIGVEGGMAGGVSGGVVSGIPGLGNPPRPQTGSRSYHYSAQWDRNSLVIDEGWSGGSQPSVERRERWVLDSRNRLSVLVTHRVGNDMPVSVAAVYRRQ